MNEHDIEKKTDEILMALGKELSKSRKVYAEAHLLLCTRKQKVKVRKKC